MDELKFIDGKAVELDDLSGLIAGIFKRGIGFDLVTKSFCAQPLADNPIKMNNRYSDFTYLLLKSKNSKFNPT